MLSKFASSAGPPKSACLGVPDQTPSPQVRRADIRERMNRAPKLRKSRIEWSEAIQRCRAGLLRYARPQQHPQNQGFFAAGCRSQIWKCRVQRQLRRAGAALTIAYAPPCPGGQLIRAPLATMTAWCRHPSRCRIIRVPEPVCARNGRHRGPVIRSIPLPTD